VVDELGRCVYVVDTFEQAEHAMQFLRAREFSVESFQRLVTYGDPLWIPNRQHHQFEIYLRDESQFEAARDLLLWEYDENANATEAGQVADEKTSTAALTAYCEHCGHEATYSHDLSGDVQKCPHCYEYLELPGRQRRYIWPAITGDDSNELVQLLDADPEVEKLADRRSRFAIRVDRFKESSAFKWLILLTLYLTSGIPGAWLIGYYSSQALINRLNDSKSPQEAAIINSWQRSPCECIFSTLTNTIHA